MKRNKKESRHVSVSTFILSGTADYPASVFTSDFRRRIAPILFIPVFPAEGGEELVQVFLGVGRRGGVAPDQGGDIAISRQNAVGLRGRALNPLDLRPFALG
jgi:hypothetical protein